MSMQQNTDLCTACTGAHQLKAGQAGTVALKSQGTWQLLSISARSYFLGDMAEVHPSYQEKKADIDK